MRIGVIASEDFPDWDLALSFLMSLDPGTMMVASDSRVWRELEERLGYPGITKVKPMGLIVGSEAKSLQVSIRCQQAAQLVHAVDKVVIFHDGKDTVTRYAWGMAHGKLLGVLRPCFFRGICGGALTWEDKCQIHSG